jgi:hypothetical protein
MMSLKVARTKRQRTCCFGLSDAALEKALIKAALQTLERQHSGEGIARVEKNCATL